MPAQFTREEILQSTTANALGKPVPFSKATISTDTRAIKQGDVFLAIQGESFDGHKFIQTAFKQGAIAALVLEKEYEQNPQWSKLPNIFTVPDTIEAYLALGRFHRQRTDVTVVAITGSSGKTTTKEMLYAAFKDITTCQYTQKNFNNEIGVSQTLLSVKPETRLLIVEMGMRGTNEIRLLAQYAQPDIAVVINAGSAHIGRLGSLQAIASAKCEIFDGLRSDSAIAILNGDDARLKATFQTEYPELSSSVRVQYVSLENANDIRPFNKSGTQFEYNEQTVTLHQPGNHIVFNALTVLAVGERLGFNQSDVIDGLSSFKPYSGRWQKTPIKGLPDVSIVNDAYNANPQSMKASVSAFLQLTPVKEDAMPHQNILVLGGMKELGSHSEEYHRELGKWLTIQPNICAVFTVGEEGKRIVDGALSNNPAFPVVQLKYAEVTPNKKNSNPYGASLLESLERLAIPLQNTTFFLKGSRAYALESIESILEHSKNKTVRHLA